MKKLLALTLALLMSLCLLTSAAAEEAAAEETTAAPAAELPNLNLPITLADYQKAYEAIVADSTTGCTVTWSSTEQERGTVWLATINNSFTGVMLLQSGEYVVEVACLVQSTLSDAALQTFLSMCGYGGAALMLDEDTDAATATQAFMIEMVTVFTSVLQGVEPEDIGGLPGGISISLLDEDTYQFYFALQLVEAAAE